MYLFFLLKFQYVSCTKGKNSRFYGSRAMDLRQSSRQKYYLSILHVLALSLWRLVFVIPPQFKSFKMSLFEFY